MSAHEGHDDAQSRATTTRPTSPTSPARSAARCPLAVHQVACPPRHAVVSGDKRELVEATRERGESVAGGGALRVLGHDAPSATRAVPVRRLTAVLAVVVRVLSLFLELSDAHVARLHRHFEYTDVALEARDTTGEAVLLG